MWRAILRDARGIALVSIASGWIDAMITDGGRASSTSVSPLPPSARGGATTARVQDSGGTMALTRRGFVRRLGRTTAGTVTGAMLATRGFEALAAAHVGRAGPCRTCPACHPAWAATRIPTVQARTWWPPSSGRCTTTATGTRACRMLLTGALPPCLERVERLAARVGGIGRSPSCGGPRVRRRTTRPLVAATPTFETPVRTAESLRLPMRLVPLPPSLSNDLDRMAEQGKGRRPASTSATRTTRRAPSMRSGHRRADRDARPHVARDGRADRRGVLRLCRRSRRTGRWRRSRPSDAMSWWRRTFSKIHGLAGMRIGYAVAHPETLERMRPYAGGGVVACASAAAAMASLDDIEYFRRQQALNREARTRLTKALTDIGYPPVPSQANFVMVDVRRDVRDFGGACRARGVLVGRPFPPLETQARISFGTPDEMTRAIEVFRQVLARGRQPRRGEQRNCHANGNREAGSSGIGVGSGDGRRRQEQHAGQPASATATWRRHWRLSHPTCWPAVLRGAPVPADSAGTSTSSGCVRRGGAGGSQCRSGGTGGPACRTRRGSAPGSIVPWCVARLAM